jgi:Flp pilus assembly protein TadG
MRNRRSSKKGQSLIEFALILPLLFLLIVNVVNYGGLIYAWIVVAHAGRSAAQYTVTGPAYLGYGSSGGLQALATNASIKTLLTTCPGGDMCSLPNLQTSNVAVSVCTNNNGVSELPPSDTPPTTGCLSPTGFTDPETTSVIATIDVKYHYCPLIPFWDFPALHIHSTMPACTGATGGWWVHRTAAMRMIQ